MPLEIRTRENSAYPTVIPGVGYLEAWGGSGVQLDTAAQTMHELQDKFGDPLDGKQLENAARTWARKRGLSVFDVKTRPPLQRQSARTGEPDGEADPTPRMREVR